MILYSSIIALLSATTAFYGWWSMIQQNRVLKRKLWAAQFVLNRHGDRLPPIEAMAAAHPADYIEELRPYYDKQAREDVVRKALSFFTPGPPLGPLKLTALQPLQHPDGAVLPTHALQSMEQSLSDPDKEPDCPECANGVAHDICRSGWKDLLRERVREFAVLRYGKMSKWRSPDITCSGSCGYSLSDHCMVCGHCPSVHCDLVKHEAKRLLDERPRPVSLPVPSGGRKVPT